MKITRKDIRRPDQFVTLTGRIFHFLQQHKTPVALSLSLILVAFLLGWAWQLYQQRQHHLAALSYSRALDAYNSRKYTAALEQLKQTATYRSSSYSRMALLYQANSYAALNQPTQAIQPLEELLRRETRDPVLRQLAFLSLAHAYENARDYPEAFRAFSEGEKIPGPFKEDLLLGKARSAALKGDPKEALAAYRQYLSHYPGSDRLTEIELKIQELEARTQAQRRDKRER